MSLFRSKGKSLVLAFLISGTLDILAAVLILAGGNAEAVFRFIAQGAFGQQAYQDGWEMVVWGFVFHYFIAFAFTLTYFLLIPYLRFLRKHPVASGLLYGLLIWCVMNFLVLPLSQNPPPPFSIEGSYLNVLILMTAVGLPVALIAQKHEVARRTSPPDSV